MAAIIENPQRKLVIHVLDDEREYAEILAPWLLRRLRRQLQFQGCNIEIRAFCDPVDYLATITPENQPHALIADQRMYGMTGEEVVTALLSDDVLRPMSLFIITADERFQSTANVKVFHKCGEGRNELADSIGVSSRHVLGFRTPLLSS